VPAPPLLLPSRAVRGPDDGQMRLSPLPEIVVDNCEIRPPHGRALPGFRVLTSIDLFQTQRPQYFSFKPTATLDDFNRGSSACAKEASPAYGIIVQDAYRSRLRARGWTREQQPEPISPGWYRGIE
jgi:hypothetical protein